MSFLIDAVEGLFGGGKVKSPDMPAAPSPTDAAETARQAQLKQRKMLLASGGATDVTHGSAAILGDDISSISLTGGL